MPKDMDFSEKKISDDMHSYEYLYDQFKHKLLLLNNNFQVSEPDQYPIFKPGFAVEQITFIEFISYIREQ